MRVEIGNIFDSKMQTIVNTINCVGVMGKGVAKEFKSRFPYMYEEYEQLCKDGQVRPGKPYLYKDLIGTSILNFPTKDHWRSPSKLSYIVEGLDEFRRHYQEWGIESIAFPPLGCGNGGLTWDVVGPVMYDKLHDLPIDVIVYAPYGTVKEKLTESFLQEHAGKTLQEYVGNSAGKLNRYWYLLLYIVQQLNNDKHTLNVGRTVFQKVCYVLTRAGIPTGFHFVAQSYGPFSREVKDAVTVLSNANLIAERRMGRMIRTVVSPDFRLDKNSFTKDELQRADRALDLLGRIKDTEHAEMLSTVMFSYDELRKDHEEVSDEQIQEYVLNWKPHWKNAKEALILDAVLDLSSLGWISPSLSQSTMEYSDSIY